ncbi:MAG: hypothetical protein ACYDD9_05115 [Acidithiobacillus sp.]
MDPTTTTPHQLDYELPDVTQGTLSASVAHRDDVTLDFTTHAGNHLLLHVPRSLFDALCTRLGNAYKAGCWVTARCREVDGLSLQSIERYVNIMTCDKFGLERGSSHHPHITVSPSTAA